jgi:hypothetical protein
VNNDEVSAEEAQGMLDRDRIAREVYGLRGGYDGARLARTVIALHRELAVLRAQLAPLLAVHDALVAAAALPGAGASPEAMVAAVRAKASADAREDLARIGCLVGCDSLVGVEIHAAVEHELLERDAARDAAERAERERAIDCDLIARQAGILASVADALKGAPAALSSHSHHDLGDVARRVTAERDDARAEVETLRAEAALMREIIEGRTTPPTREAFIALGATDGTVRYHRPDGGHGWFPAIDPWWGAVVSLCREGARLWAHDADGRPCAWPTVTP